MIDNNAAFKSYSNPRWVGTKLLTLNIITLVNRSALIDLKLAFNITRGLVLPLSKIFFQSY